MPRLLAAFFTQSEGNYSTSSWFVMREKKGYHVEVNSQEHEAIPSLPELRQKLESNLLRLKAAAEAILASPDFSPTEKQPAHGVLSLFLDNGDLDRNLFFPSPTSSLVEKILRDQLTSIQEVHVQIIDTYGKESLPSLREIIRTLGAAPDSEQKHPSQRTKTSSAPLQPRVYRRSSERKPKKLKKLEKETHNLYRFLLILATLYCLYLYVPRGLSELDKKNFNIDRIEEQIDNLHFVLDADFFDTFRQVLDERIAELPPPTAISQPQIIQWQQLLVEELSEMGLDDKNPFWSQQTSLDKQENRVLGNARVYNTYGIREDLLASSRQFIAVQSHELAHIEAEHMTLNYYVPPGTSEFATALWSSMHTEVEAQLFGLEAIARIALTHPDARLRAQAREAALEMLLHIRGHGEWFMNYRYEDDLNADQKDGLQNGYYYGYMPLVTLQRLLHNPETTVPTIEHDILAITRYVREVPLTYTRRFLVQEGFSG